MDANKVVYVAGYTEDLNGDVVRHPNSSGCDAVSGACVWVPFNTPGVGSGTSFGAPRVAAALASVLAVFPHTTPPGPRQVVETNRAREVDTLPNGLGVVDFTRLTLMDDTGEWRLVANKRRIQSCRRTAEPERRETSRQRGRFRRISPFPPAAKKLPWER